MFARARTEDGAVAAAAGYVRTGQAFLDMDTVEVEAAVRTMAAATSADALLADTLARLDAARAALVGTDAPIEYHQAILSVRLDDFGPGRPRVSVWSVGVLSREGVAPPQASWNISTFDLAWQREDWKVLAESIVPGPAPITNAAAPPATSAQLRQRLADFEPIGGQRLLDLTDALSGAVLGGAEDEALRFLTGFGAAPVPASLGALLSGRATLALA